MIKHKFKMNDSKTEFYNFPISTFETNDLSLSVGDTRKYLCLLRFFYSYISLHVSGICNSFSLAYHGKNSEPSNFGCHYTTYSCLNHYSFRFL